MLVLASFYSDYATVAAALAASIAVMGFVFQAIPVLRKDDKVRVRQMTTVGGLAGFGIGVAVLVSEVAFQ